MRTSDSRHLSLLSTAAPDRVYALARDLRQLPTWAAGLAAGELNVLDADTVELESPMGRVRVVFTAHNDLGVLDHVVTLPDGTGVHNPLRVLAHPSGSEIIFSLRRGDTDAGAFEADCRAVLADLARLLALLEEPRV